MHQGRSFPLLRRAGAVPRVAVWLAGLLLAVVLGEVIAPAGAGSEEAPDDAPQGPVVLTKNITRDDHPPTFRASVDFPEVDGLASPPAQAAINDEVEREVMQVLDAFTGRPHHRVDDHEVDSLVGRFQTVTFDQRITSFRLFFSEVPSGAAHGLTEARTLTFDTRRGHRYRLGELFRPGSRYLDRLSEVSRRVLAEQLEDPQREWIEDGTKPRKENFGGWVLAGDALEITFAEYQVGPFAEGLPTIRLPAESLSDIVDPGGPLTAG